MIMDVKIHLYYCCMLCLLPLCSGSLDVQLSETHSNSTGDSGLEHNLVSNLPFCSDLPIHSTASCRPEVADNGANNPSALENTNNGVNEDQHTGHIQPLAPDRSNMDHSFHELPSGNREDHLAEQVNPQLHGGFEFEHSHDNESSAWDILHPNEHNRGPLPQGGSHFHHEDHNQISDQERPLAPSGTDNEDQGATMTEHPGEDFREREHQNQPQEGPGDNADTGLIHDTGQAELLHTPISRRTTTSFISLILESGTTTDDGDQSYVRADQHDTDGRGTGSREATLDTTHNPIVSRTTYMNTEMIPSAKAVDDVVSDAAQNMSTASSVHQRAEGSTRMLSSEVSNSHMTSDIFGGGTTRPHYVDFNTNGLNVSNQANTTISTRSVTTPPESETNGSSFLPSIPELLATSNSPSSHSSSPVGSLTDGSMRVSSRSTSIVSASRTFSSKQTPKSSPSPSLISTPSSLSTVLAKTTRESLDLLPTSMDHNTNTNLLNASSPASETPSSALPEPGENTTLKITESTTTYSSTSEQIRTTVVQSSVQATNATKSVLNSSLLTTPTTLRDSPSQRPRRSTTRINERDTRPSLSTSQNITQSTASSTNVSRTASVHFGPSSINVSRTVSVHFRPNSTQSIISTRSRITNTPATTLFNVTHSLIPILRPSTRPASVPFPLNITRSSTSVVSQASHVNVTKKHQPVTAKPPEKGANSTYISPIAVPITTSLPREATVSFPLSTRSPNGSHNQKDLGYRPSVYIRMELQMGLPTFCSIKNTFLTELVKVIHEYNSMLNVDVDQVVIINIFPKLCEQIDGEASLTNLMEQVRLDLYFRDVHGKVDITLTQDCAKVIKPGFQSNAASPFSQKLVNVKLVSEPHGTQATVPKSGEVKKSVSMFGDGMTIVIVVAAVGGVCCLCLIVLQMIIHRRHGKRMSPFVRRVSRTSFHSLDSIALGVVPKSRPHSGFWNAALEQEIQVSNKEPSHSVDFEALSKIVSNESAMELEFHLIPISLHNQSCVPIGAEDKNRYANVLPVPETRVKLTKQEGDENSEYINANYVSGYKAAPKTYIATQAPLEDTVNDFWRMVWQEQSRTIVMLCPMEVKGHSRVPEYWPTNEGYEHRQQYGDYCVTLKKKEVFLEYTLSVLELKDIENNLLREIRHFWLTCWTAEDMPDPISLVKFVLDSRPYYEDTGKPLIVHCCPGTGRTGTVIGLDICMRSFEAKRQVDVFSCVQIMRQERSGAVQTLQQYILLYKAVHEYASLLNAPRSSQTSLT